MGVPTAEDTNADLVHAPAGEQRLQDQAPRRWVRALSRLTVGGAVAILAVVAAVKVISSAGFAELTGTWALVVTSGSMTPAFEAGDLVVVRTAQPDDVRVGDIVTFSVGDSRRTLVTHRVVGTETDPEEGIMFTTKGDANQSIDATPLTADRLLGRYAFRVPRLGMAVANFAGMGIILLLLLAVVLASAALTGGRVGRRSGHPTPPADPTHNRETQGRER